MQSFYFHGHTRSFDSFYCITKCFFTFVKCPICCTSGMMFRCDHLDLDDTCGDVSFSLDCHCCSTTAEARQPESVDLPAHMMDTMDNNKLAVVEAADNMMIANIADTMDSMALEYNNLLCTDTIWLFDCLLGFLQQQLHRFLARYHFDCSHFDRKRFVRCHFGID